MSRAMKDSGIAWIGEIPEEWRILALKYLCTMQAGKNLISEKITEEGLFSVYGGNGQRGYYCEYNCEGAKLVVGRQGALCGNVHKVDGRIWATEHAVITDATSLVTQDFLYYLLIGMNLNQYASSTAAQPGLAVSTIQNVRTCLPPLSEQEKIARFLDSECARIDAVIEQTRASIEEYKKLKQAVITQAVTKGIRPNRIMKDSGIQWIEQIPEEWTMLRGKWLFHETDERSEDGNEELLTVSHITGITPRSQKNVNMFMAESLVGYKICRVNDLAANTMWMWQGAIGVSKYYGVISPSYNTYRQTNNHYHSAYLDYLLRIQPLVDAYNANSTGITASRLRLYPNQFLSILFPIPPMEEQIEISNYLDEKIGEIKRLSDKKEIYLSELENLKKSLVFEYITGKRDI